MSTNVAKGALSLASVWPIRLKLWAEGAKLWAEAILEVHGNITLQWVYRQDKQQNACLQETGEVFEP